MQGTLAAPYRARRTSERAERAHLFVGVREQQIGSLPASPEVTTAWTRAPESPTAELAGGRIPKAQNPRLRIPIPKLLLGRKFSAGLSAWSVRPRPTLCFELIESLNPTYNPTSRSSEPQRGRLDRVPGPRLSVSSPPLLARSTIVYSNSSVAEWPARGARGWRRPSRGMARPAAGGRRARMPLWRSSFKVLRRWRVGTS